MRNRVGFETGVSVMDYGNNRVLSPSISALASGRVNLTPGEKVVLTFFLKHLPRDWEIYVQPHMNGRRPDFVLLNPKVGIGVFEVKDWTYDVIRYGLSCSSQGELYLSGLVRGEQKRLERKNPIPQVREYKSEIYSLYCPRLADKYGFATITAGVILPFEDTNRAREVFSSFLEDGERGDNAKYFTISGRREIESGDILSVFPEASRSSSKFMAFELAADLRGWLVEPEYAKEERAPLVLDQHQRSLASKRTTSGYRRIKGPAGSGKSVVLAATAARIMNDGKNVLVASFNITLWHYLKSLIRKELNNPSVMDRAEFTHFHLWCKRICHKAGRSGAYKDIFQHDDALEVGLPNLTLECLNLLLRLEGKEGSTFERYDAILVDEGQDYSPLWWGILRKALKPDGEMILVADTTQDVYGNASSWTDQAMQGAGFNGPWSKLSVGYRLPSAAHDVARDFATRYLPETIVTLPEASQANLNLDPCKLRWVQCDDKQAAEISLEQIFDIMKYAGMSGSAVSDITFLTDDNTFGEGFTKLLEAKNINFTQTFHPLKSVQRRRKMGFYMNSAVVKATTVHSFKGWESSMVVYCITRAEQLTDLSAVYAGLTRIKRSPEGSFMTVVSTVDKLIPHGQTWPEFIDRRIRSFLLKARPGVHVDAHRFRGGPVHPS